jgi:pimeloyl-ACP methyl ester carboxylesterase
MRKGYFETCLGQLHYVEAGSGRPLIVLPPAPRSWRVFEALIVRLSRECRVISIDPPGCGESAATAEFPAFEAIGDALAEALAGFEAPVAVFGLHAGLKMAVALAARHPGRVERLILCGKSHSIAPDMDLRNRATMSVVQASYFSGGAGESAGGDPLRAWAAEGRGAMGHWWADAIFTAPEPAGMIRATAAKLSDGLLARDSTVASYRANFAFDLAANARLVRAPATVIEITTPEEDLTIGRQGVALASLMGATAIAVPQTDPTGLAVYIGVENLAELICAALDSPARK